MNRSGLLRIEASGNNFESFGSVPPQPDGNQCEHIGFDQGAPINGKPLRLDSNTSADTLSLQDSKFKQRFSWSPKRGAITLQITEYKSGFACISDIEVYGYFE